MNILLFKKNFGALNFECRYILGILLHIAIDWNYLNKTALIHMIETNYLASDFIHSTKKKLLGYIYM